MPRAVVGARCRRPTRCIAGPAGGILLVEVVPQGSRGCLAVITREPVRGQRPGTSASKATRRWVKPTGPQPRRMGGARKHEPAPSSSTSAGRRVLPLRTQMRTRVSSRAVRPSTPTAGSGRPPVDARNTSMPSMVRLTPRRASTGDAGRRRRRPRGAHRAPREPRSRACARRGASVVAVPNGELVDTVSTAANQFRWLPESTMRPPATTTGGRPGGRWQPVGDHHLTGSARQTGRIEGLLHTELLRPRAEESLGHAGGPRRHEPSTQGSERERVVACGFTPHLGRFSLRGDWAGLSRMTRGRLIGSEAGHHLGRNHAPPPAKRPHPNTRARPRLVAGEALSGNL